MQLFYSGFHRFELHSKVSFMNFKFLPTEMGNLLSSCFLTWPIYLSSESAQKLTSRCGLQISLPQTPLIKKNCWCFFYGWPHIVGKIFAIYYNFPNFLIYFWWIFAIQIHFCTRCHWRSPSLIITTNFGSGTPNNIINKWQKVGRHD